MGETKPKQLSSVPSITYSDFRADFRRIDSDRRFLYCRFGWRRPAKPNQANVAKAFVISNVGEKSVNQTEPAYRTCYPLFTAILAAIIKEFGWKRRGSLSRIRAHGQGGRVGLFQRSSVHSCTDYRENFTVGKVPLPSTASPQCPSFQWLALRRDLGAVIAGVRM
jgi:hypothetical protein